MVTGMMTISAVPAQGVQNPARAANTPKWEAVSIKRCGLDSVTEGQRGEAAGPPFTFSPDRMTLRCVNVKSLIKSAYQTYFEDPNLPFPGRDGVLLGGEVPEKTRIDGPGWLSSERYTIEAKAERAVDRGMMQGPMLQIILEDRFLLKVHRENREIPVYALALAKGGPKLKPFREGSCAPRPSTEINGLSSLDLAQRPPQLPPGQKYCTWGGGVNGNAEPVLVAITAEGATVDQFLKIFVGELEGKQVIDRTNLKGKFAVHLEYAMNDQDRQRYADVTGRPLTEIPSSPSIFTALQEQLGLRLEATKAPVEHLVIDRVERPSPN
jgi:uncharacterized protein (TIGR03435 family)